MPQAGPGDYAALGQDIEVGSDDFDASFVVKGYDPGAVCDLLSPEVREALLELAAAGTIEVDDKDLHARDLPLDPDMLVPLVNAAQRAAVAMGW